MSNGRNQVPSDKQVPAGFQVAVNSIINTMLQIASSKCSAMCVALCDKQQVTFDRFIGVYERWYQTWVKPPNVVARYTSRTRPVEIAFTIDVLDISNRFSWDVAI